MNAHGAAPNALFLVSFLDGGEGIGDHGDEKVDKPEV